jgi:type I restriction enzyme S subunit
MSNAWPTVKLGEVLQRSEETIELQPDVSYRQITVKLWGKGVVLRGILTGAEVAASRQMVARRGQFILSRIDARNGALGIVPPELDEAIVTNDFPVFNVVGSRVLPTYLGWMCRTASFVEECRRASEGTTNRVRLQEDKFLAREIPLPPLAEQRRLVARIEELAARIDEVRTLRLQAAEETAALVARKTSKLLDESDWDIKPLADVLRESPRNGLSPRQPVETGGREMLRINAVSSAPTRFVDTTAVKHVQVSEKDAEPFVVQNDDVFIVRYNGDINRVAKPGIYKGANQNRIVYPDKLMRLRPDRAAMTPDFLVFALSSRSVRHQIEALGKTTAGNIGISGANAKSFRVPVPSLSEQRRIVAELDALRAEVDALKRLQADAAAKLDALLPAILDRAFKGEL